jgi:hypothetical protein
MSDYYLADLKAEERERQRRAAAEPKRESTREPKERVNTAGAVSLRTSIFF